MAREYTTARRQGNKRWEALHLDRIYLAIPKGQKDIIKAHAAAKGESVNRFICRAIYEALEREQ